MPPVTSAAPPEGGVPKPTVRVASLPHALTFFLSAVQRRAVLRALRRLNRSREAALLRALGLAHQRPSRPPRRRPGAPA